jgi:cytochrome c peroxidase
MLLVVLAMGTWLLLPVSDPPSAGASASATPEHFRAITHPSTALLPLPPLPPLTPVVAARAALGQRLFFEPRLSHDNSLSCASCHDLAHAGMDRRATALGIGAQVGPINTPTVFNADLNLSQFWDGRAPSLEAQAGGPVHNPIEMGSNWQEVTAKLSRDPSYAEAFRRLYPKGLDGAAIADAIATFERTLRTPNSRFDRFLMGDGNALTAQEKKGYAHFMELGCASCHQGMAIGGNMFQRFGVMEDYFQNRTTHTADLGRFSVTQQPQDLHVFKVPSLRNVALTAPYFHDASAQTLDDAVRIMGQYQLGRSLTAGEVGDIVAFLRTLNGEWQGRPLQ